ncbi:transposable element Tcb2 transposase [Trichonephila clavipes]|nr:transposable element Tcb2 transposase [Trichonephila clavipes]
MYKGMEAQSWSGVFVWHSLVSFVRVPTSFKAIRCVELLGDHLHPFMLICYPRGNAVFQQDNCSSHKLRLATGWLDEYYSNFSVINCSPRRQDLSPIEHIWDVLEKGVKVHHAAPMNLTELWTVLANIWQVISSKRFHKLVGSMPHHVAAVFKARGGSLQGVDGRKSSREKVSSCCLFIFEEYKGTPSMSAEWTPHHDTFTRPLHREISIVHRWVPHNLTEHQKEESVRNSKETLKLLNDGRHRNISKIVTGGETYMPFFDVPIHKNCEVWDFEDGLTPTMVKRQ